ncbi:MAG: ribose 5-phosphate isomerase B [Bradymonadaceae bacterium]
MIVGFGSDHAGFDAKQQLADYVREFGHDVRDFGPEDDASVDYPDYARPVAEAVAAGELDRGILICGSGIGVAVAANKVPGVRASVCHDTYSARQGVEHDDLNVLCLGGRVVGSELQRELVRAFLGAEFDGVERHRRRLEKVEAIERDALQGGESAS